jgi:branched-chain amino acid transport system permease protein
MTELAQLVVSGLATGAIYAIAAMGFTLLWQTSGAINFAQGEFVMLPGFFMLGFLLVPNMPLLGAFLLTVLLSALVLGWGFKRGIVDPMLRHGVLPLVIATIALGIALKHIVKVAYSVEAQPFPNLFPPGVWKAGGVAVSIHDIGVLAVTLVLVGGLQLFLARTTTGRAMQAVAQNQDAARILGIDVPRMILLTFIINGILAATAALLVTPIYLAKFDLGESLGLKAFYAAIIGGFNQMRGALVGGLLIGVLENLSAAYVSHQYKDAVALVLFVAIILFRPAGLLGKSEERRV